jgi:phosphoribosylaminoimidazole synthetase
MHLASAVVVLWQILHCTVPCAGFAVGSVEKARVVTGDSIAPGDVLVALPSSGVHSNGFSLVRMILERAKLSLHDPAPWDGAVSVGASLLTPTKLYVKDVLAVHDTCGFKGAVHITGGGFYENIPRVLPKSVGCEIDAAAWQPLPVFGWLQEAGALCHSHLLCPRAQHANMQLHTAAAAPGSRKLHVAMP